MTQKSTIVRIIQTAAPILSRAAPDLAARWLARLFITPMKWTRPEREVRWLGTATRRAIRFDSDRDLPLYVWGEGPTVLLVHGWSGRGSQMAVFAEPLVRRGYRVVAFDAPAHGDASGTRTALPELATAVESVARAVGPVHAIIGHSLGAAATTVALHRGLDTDRVVFIAPPARPARYLDRAAAMLRFSEPVARRTQQRLEARFGLRFDDARGSKLAPDLRIPMLAIHDKADSEVPHAEGEALVARWPGAVLLTVNGLGHRRILRDAAVVRATLDFVDGPRETHLAAAGRVL